MCGLAALQMIQNFYHLPIEKKYLDELKAEALANQGTSGASLKEAMVNSGYHAVVFPGNLTHDTAGLYHHLDAGHPLIVMIGTELKRHYLVAFGYDPGNQQIYFNDPLNGPISFSAESFLKFWTPANNFAFLAFPKN